MKKINIDHSKEEEIRTSLTKWLIFSVCIALAPLVCKYLGMTDLNHQNFFLGFLELFSENGELLIIATVLAAEGTGEILLTSKTRSSTKILAGGTGILILVFACYLLPVLSTGENATEKDINAAKIIFGASLVTSAACKIIKAGEIHSSEEKMGLDSVKVDQINTPTIND